MTFQYIAGFFDGEGSVTTYVSDNRKRPRPYGNAPAPKPHLSFSQSDPRILFEIQAFLGYGSIYRNRLTIRGKQSVIHFADHVGPHLRIKKRRVMLARELATLIGDHNDPVSTAVFDQRVELAGRIRAITAREKERRAPWQG
jgi:hypothetical protein